LPTIVSCLSSFTVFPLSTRDLARWLLCKIFTDLNRRCVPLRDVRRLASTDAIINVFHTFCAQSPRDSFQPHSRGPDPSPVEHGHSSNDGTRYSCFQLILSHFVIHSPPPPGFDERSRSPRDKG
jgi:hypothetical protein